MIVHCEQCKSKFRLDDAKVKDAGVKVRCSKCRHIFMVFPEQKKEDFEFDDLLRGFGPAAGAVVEQPEDEGHRWVAEHGQESSSASDDIPFAADEPSAGQVASEADGYSFDELSSGDEGGAGSGVDLAAGGDMREDEFNIASLLDQNDSVPEEAASQEFQGLDVFDNLGFSADEPATADDQQVVDRSVQEDDLQSEVLPFADPTVAPDEGRDEFSFPDTAEVPVVPEFAEAFAGTAPEEAVGEEHNPPEDPGAAVTELPSLPSVSRRRQHSVLPLIVTAISIVFILLLAAGGLLFMKGGPKQFEKLGLGFLPQLMGLQTEEEGTISVRGMTGSFLENKEAGEIFVVAGEAVNGFAKPRAAIQVRALLYGPGGNILSRRLAYCGNTLTTEQLKTLPITKIESAMNNQFGDSLSNLGVAPGKGIPFVVVFTKVPDKAVDYGVEIAGSTVAGK